MRTLLHGVNGSATSTDGFIMLRELLVMFLVIICFAAAVSALAVLSHHGSRLLENTQREIGRQNELMLKRVSHETN